MGRTKNQTKRKAREAREAAILKQQELVNLAKTEEYLKFKKEQEEQLREHQKDSYCFDEDCHCRWFPKEMTQEQKDRIEEDNGLLFGLKPPVRAKTQEQKDQDELYILETQLATYGIFPAILSVNSSGYKHQ
jgi:hypothetical protein